MSLRICMLGLLVFGWGCATTHGPYDYASEPDPRKGEFILGPSDVVKITVWRNPDLSTEAIVRPDGTVSMPLAGDLPAAGRTAAQIKEEIVKRLRAYFKDESLSVTVAVSAINSYRFVVSGNVEKPGVFSANHYVTVGEAMALAGGPNRFADAGGTVIIRLTQDGGTRRIPVDYLGVLSGKAANENLTLLAGDTIYVP
ncbi:MAG TPA: polysaccharide biosynthesis/export family protein [Polyangia bacterium]|nr:polysaccharide biosynthesis/export family protein [Polyangia bacterium]